MYDLKVKDGGTVFLGNTEEKVYDSDSIFILDAIIEKNS